MQILIQITSPVRVGDSGYHVPAYPSHRLFDGPQSKRVRELWVPLFEQHHVDVVFENHDHTYKRTHRILAGKVDAAGVLCVADRAWGVPPRKIKTEPAEETWYLDETNSVHHFILVTLEGDKRELTMMDDEGKVFDRFTGSRAAKKCAGARASP